MADNKSSLQNVLSSILAVGNSEQNTSYPPFIYQQQYNTVTSLIISFLVKSFPTNPMVIDILAPFVETEKIAIANGIIQLPLAYRNILGTPMVNIAPDGSGECGLESSVPITAQNFFVENLKAGCRRRPVVILPQAEFALRTTSKYKYPTYNDPIGYFIGKNRIQVCPFDLAKVEVMYVRNENTYVYGYLMQPDDTFIQDINTTTETEWNSNAFELLFKGISHLYAVYSRDRSMTEWAQILTQAGIF